MSVKHRRKVSSTFWPTIRKVVYLYLKQELAKQFINHMEQSNSLPSLWQLGDYVSLTFPGNGILKKAKVIKIAFTTHTEPLYDVEVPFEFYLGDYDPDNPDMPTNGHVRLHGLKEWHLRNPESPISDRINGRQKDLFGEMKTT